MLNPAFALELAYIAVEEAQRLRAAYADARYEAVWAEAISVGDGRLRAAESSLRRGLGVRVLVGGAWGFAAVSEPTRHDVAVAVRRAVELARAAAIVQQSPVRLAEQDAQRGVFRTPFRLDPMTVSLDEKLNLLTRLDDALRSPARIVAAQACLRAQRRRKLFVSSDGGEIDQDLLHTGVVLRATASDGEAHQTRSYLGSDGLLLGRGYELAEEAPLAERASQIAGEAVLLLDADPCPEGPTQIILGAGQVAHHIAHGVTPLLELDRVIGLGADGHGGTFLRTVDLGARMLASKHVTVAVDGRERSGPGTVGFDDEGVCAERVELVSEGRVGGFISSRETAAQVGLERSQGGMRATTWSEPPRVCASNVLLEPGTGDLEALVGGTDRGVLLEGPRSFSVDPWGRTFAATCEIAWAIEGGRRVRPLRDASYRGGTEPFWRSCDGVAGPEAWSMHGVRTRGGDGARLAMGVGAAPARFADVEVGTRTPLLAPVSGSGPLPIDRETVAAAPPDDGPRPRLSPASARDDE